TTSLMLCPASAHAQGGVPLWTNRYDGPGKGFDSPFAIAVDSSGNVFVTGGSYNGSSQHNDFQREDYATIAYSNSGVPLWTNRYDGPANSEDEPQAMAVDHSGNVFVTGHSVAENGWYDWTTISYSNVGVPLWTNRYDGPGNLDDTPSAITVD